MARRYGNDPVEPQSQSQRGKTGRNPNEDAEDGNQSTSDTSTSGEAPAEGTTSGTSTPSDGGNPSAYQQ